jgi:hypothetical protein
MMMKRGGEDEEDEAAGERALNLRHTLLQIVQYHALLGSYLDGDPKSKYGSQCLYVPMTTKHLRTRMSP